VGSISNFFVTNQGPDFKEFLIASSGGIYTATLKSILKGKA
jgi:hypothetical protein